MGDVVYDPDGPNIVVRNPEIHSSYGPGTRLVVRDTSVKSVVSRGGIRITLNADPRQLVIGIRGFAGAQGAQGIQGIPGATGAKGDKGDTGAAGGMVPYDLNGVDFTVLEFTQALFKMPINVGLANLIIHGYLLQVH